MSLSVVSNSNRLFFKAGHSHNFIDKQGIKEANFFQTLFKRATVITINGKKYSVNTNSLKKFLVRISTNDHNLQQIASKDAPETDENKKIRDFAYNALIRTANTKKQDFGTLISNRILQLHRSTLPNFSISYLSYFDASKEDKWDDIFQKSAESHSLPSLDFSNPLFCTDFVEISHLDAASLEEKDEREYLLEIFQAALTIFYHKQARTTHSNPIIPIVEKSKQLPLQTLRKNVDIATKLAAMIESENKCHQLKAREKTLEQNLQEIHEQSEKAEEQIAQLIELGPKTQMILSNLDGETLVAENVLKSFEIMPQLHAKLLAYNHNIREINRLNQELSNFDSIEQANYLAALTGVNSELTDQHKEIEAAHQHLMTLQGKLTVRTDRSFETHNFEKRRIEIIEQHLALLDQLLLSSPSSSKLDQFTAKAKRTATGVALLTAADVEERKVQLHNYIDEHILERDKLPNSSSKRDVVQEMITRNEQTLSYYNLFGNKQALSQAQVELKSELASLKQKVSLSDKNQKNQTNLDAAKLKTEIAQLHQRIKAHETAFWKIVDAAEKSTTKKKVNNIMSKIKALPKKKTDLSDKALTDTAQFLATLHTEMGKCHLELKNLIASCERINREINSHQSLVKEQMSQLQKSLNFDSNLQELKAHQRDQQLAFEAAQDELFSVKQQVTQAERANTDLYISFILYTEHRFKAVEEACLINTCYLLSTAVEGHSKSQMIELLKKLRKTSNAIDFSSYENPMLLVGVKEWLIAQAA